MLGMTHAGLDRCSRCCESSRSHICLENVLAGYEFSDRNSVLTARFAIAVDGIARELGVAGRFRVGHDDREFAIVARFGFNGSLGYRDLLEVKVSCL